MRRLLTAIALLALASIAVIAAVPDAPPPPEPVANRAFVTRTPTAPVTIWAVGDGADGGATAKRLARLIERDDPNRLLYLGDVYDRGTREEFRRNYHSVYGALAKKTAPTPGNHEWPRHLQGYDPYWRSITGRATPPWYAFRAG